MILWNSECTMGQWKLMTGRDCDELRMAWVMTYFLPVIATRRFSPRLRTSDNGWFGSCFYFCYILIWIMFLLLLDLFIYKFDPSDYLVWMRGIWWKYMMKTMYTWKDTVTWVHIESGDYFDEYYMGHHAKQLQFYVILFYVFGLLFLSWYYCICFHFNVHISCLIYLYFIFKLF